MAEAFVVVVSLVLNALLPYAIVKWDLARLPEALLARAWTDASFLSAVLVFGPLALPVHFTKTRRSLTGLGLGLSLCAVSVALESLILAGLGAVLGAG